MQAMWEFVNSYNGHCHSTTVSKSIISLSLYQEFLIFWGFNWQVLMAMSLQTVSSRVISDMVFSITLSFLEWNLRLSGMGIFEQSLLLRWHIFNLIFIPSTNIINSWSRNPFSLLSVSYEYMNVPLPHQSLIDKDIPRTKEKGISWDFALYILEKTYVPLSAGQSTLK